MSCPQVKHFLGSFPSCKLTRNVTRFGQFQCIEYGKEFELLQRLKIHISRKSTGVKDTKKMLDLKAVPKSHPVDYKKVENCEHCETRKKEISAEDNVHFVDEDGVECRYVFKCEE